MIMFRIRGTTILLWASEGRAADIASASPSAKLSVYAAPEANNDDLVTVCAGWLERVSEAPAVAHRNGGPDRV